MKKSHNPPSSASSASASKSKASGSSRLPSEQTNLSRPHRPPARRNESLTSPADFPTVSPLSQPASREGDIGPLPAMDRRDPTERPKLDAAGDGRPFPLQGFRRSSAYQAQDTAVDGTAPSSPLSRVRDRHSISEDSDSTVRENMSPTLEEAFGSPLARGPQTGSTHSTDSANTVRGASAPTPGPSAVRTPSYPFPYVPTVAFKRGSTPLHQPFLALSPTSSTTDVRPRNTAKEVFERQKGRQDSDAPSMTTGERSQDPTSDFQIPTPNLYNIILQLNSELTIDAWWSSLICVMRESYKIDRMSLAVPVDPSDVEGIPWGQKLSYDAGGIKGSLASTDPSWSTRSASSRFSESKDQSPGGLRAPARPPLETRHSYAGYEAVRIPESEPIMARPASSARPTASRRVTTHTPVLGLNRLSGTQKLTLENLPQHVSELADNEHPESRAAHDGSREEINYMVYSNLRALDREPDALLEPAGVNRILERGSMVALTRNFSDEQSPSLGKQAADVQGEEDKVSQLFNQSRKSSLADDPRQELKSSLVYEDYEQTPSTPWSQSPAPSPAIQNDPDENPFFATTAVNEASFEPTTDKQDYNEYQNIEAIGIDNAYTVVHLPLVHPSLSKVFVSEYTSSRRSSRAGPGATEEDTQITSDVERKIPIAILSLSSSFVPYHSNLAQSLRDLGPHLATSFNTCLQNSNIQDRISKALRRKHRSGQLLDFVPTGLGLGPDLGLESLLQFDQDDRSSTIESVTSPSEYSGRSGHSPIGSALGTPSMESAPHSSSNSRSVSIESSGEYFEAHDKRISIERSRSSNVVPQTQQKAQVLPSKSTPWDHRSVLQRIESSSVTGDNASDQRKKEQKRTKIRETTVSTKPPGKGRVQTSAQADVSETRHSLLHSHGADFKASFQTLPATTIPRTPSVEHTRSPSLSDGFAMPPPSERLLRLIIDGLPVQIFTAAPVTGKVTWVNSKLLQYQGVSAENALNEPWDAIHPDDREDYMQGWSLSLHTGKQFQQKVRLRRYDGVYRYFYVRASPLRTNEQRIVHWFGTMFDLHDQHIAEVNAAHQQETAASEAKYRALANSSPQIVFAVNPKRGVSFCNTQWTAYSGQTEEEAKGAGFMDHVFPDDLEKCKLPSFEEDGSASNNVPISMPPKPHRTPSGASSGESSDVSVNTVTSPISSTGMQMPQRKLSELASTGILRVSKDETGKPSYSTEVRLRSKSGGYRWHLVRVLLADPLIQSEAQEETWYGTCTDINDHKELEQTLKETMDAKSRFLSNMSHEIRTPLNGIWGMTNFLIDSKLNGEQMDQVNVIRSSTEGLRDLINDILDLSKVEAGMITLSVDWLNIRSVIEEVNDLTSSLSLDKGVELNYLVENNVPSVLKGDKYRFRQILLNVIGNAIKFTEEGEVFVHCTVSDDEPNDKSDESTTILIEVRDTGAGFSESEAERLFKRFSQIDGSSTRQHGGSGLGLVISMQLVELHGGTMTATSAVGKGSTFSFTLRFGLPSDADTASWKSASSTNTPLEKPGEKETKQATLLQSAGPGSGLPSFSSTVTGSPAAYDSLSPSSAGSGQSVRTVRTSLRSSRSSQSSRASADAATMNLELRPKSKAGEGGSSSSKQGENLGPGAASAIQHLLRSILVVCPLPWMQEATVGHLESILSKNVAHMITARASYKEAQELVGSKDVVFTHVVIVVRNVSETTELMDEVFRSAPASTSVVIISDMKQRNEIAYRTTPFDFPLLSKESRLQFIQKPIKPSKLAVIFDPSKSLELSTDQNQSSAQQIAINQRRLFEEMTSRLGDRDIRVLLVEDNPINQMVMLKLLQRVSIGVETVGDGVQATEKVLSKPSGYYSIILMDLMMPNKDGYETCRDIRTWENSNDYSPIPIVALSANVLDDVWRKCREAGFNSYLTKPVEFKELSDVMIAFLDPEDPSKPIAFMKNRDGGGSKSSKR